MKSSLEILNIKLHSANEKKKPGNLQRAIRGIKIKHRDKRVKAKQKNQNHSKLQENIKQKKGSKSRKII